MLLQVARFVRFCDSFSFPLLVLLDPSPVHTPAPAAPQTEDLSGAAQLMFAFVEASVPKLAVLLSPEQTTSLINAQVRRGVLFVGGWQGSAWGVHW